MKTTLKKRAVTQAVITALNMTALAMPIATMALTLDVQNNKAVPDGEGGDALLFPIYTTGNGTTGAVTSFSLTNQFNDTIALRIRFREQKVSMDALNFMVIMSPYDNFAFWIAPGDNGRPVVEWSDTTCVVGPTSGQTSVEFPATSTWLLQGSGITDADLAVGNVEVFGLASLRNACVNAISYEPIMTNGSGSCAAAGGINLANAARHVGVERIPANCQILKDFFSDSPKVQMANENSNGNGISDWDFPTFLPVPNVLAGRYVITIPGHGIEGEGDPITIQNANVTHGSSNPARYGGNFVGLVTAQSPAYCSDYRNCMSKYAWDQEEYSHPHFGEMASFANLQRLMSAASVAADWSSNPANAVATDWVVTFPTKYAYMDLLSGIQCINNGIATTAWCLMKNTKTGLGLSSAWVDVNSQNLTFSRSLNIWGTEEETAVSYTVSPSGGSYIRLSNVINTISFSQSGSYLEDLPSLIQTDALRTIVKLGWMPTRGWASLPIGRYTDTVTGLVFTARNTDDPGENMGSIGTLRINPIATNPIPITDFVVTNIVLNPAAPTANGTFTATVAVKNQGDFYGDGKFLDVWSHQPASQACGALGNQRQAIGALTFGETKVLTFIGLPAGTAGSKMLRAVVDSGCSTAETNESNNQATVVYAVNQTTGVDFIVTNITLNPVTPSANGTFIANVTVKNQGPVAGDGKNLDVWHHQPAAQVCGAIGTKRVAVGTLTAGQSKSFAVSLPSGIALAKTLRAFVDSGCGTAENAEGNNQMIKAYTVQ